VTLKNCEGTLVAGCTIRNTGLWGVSIEGGRSTGAAGNDIYATGAGGVSINSGDRQTLTRGDCYADNNYIHHIAVFQRTYNTGVNLSGVGNRASHNLIHDCYHQALLVAATTTSWSTTSCTTPIWARRIPAAIHVLAGLYPARHGHSL